MALRLEKGSSVSLSKEDPTVNEITVGLGWQERETDGAAFDLDASCFLLKENGKVRTEQDLIFYNGPRSINGAVRHTGDDKTGGDGSSDCEQIIVQLSMVPQTITQLVFVVTIYKARERRQNFGMVRRAYIRIVNNRTQEDILRFDLTEEASTSDSILFGRVYRDGTDWRFRADGIPSSGGLEHYCSMYGIEVEQ